MKSVETNKRTRGLVVASVLVTLFASLPAWADRDNNRGGYDRDHRDRREHREEHRERWRHEGYIRARHDHDVIYLRGGHFYRDSPRGFISIGIPFGAIVASLPIGHVRVTIGGTGYFFADGLYYRPYPTGGYQVVEVPTPTVTRVTPGAVMDTHQVLISVSALNVRSGPGLNFGIVEQVYQGVRVRVHGTSPGWYYIRTPDGRYGWIMMRFTSPAQEEPQG